MPGLDLFEVVLVVGVALPGQKDSLGLFRDVHVVEKVVIEVAVFDYVPVASVEVSLGPLEGLGDGGEGYGMALEVSRLEDGRIGSGVGDVLSDVQPAVDAGKHQVEFHVKAVVCKADAVGRCGVHAVAVDSLEPLDFLHLERGVDVDAVALGALFDLGSHDGYFAELARPVCKDLESGSPDSVIVGDKDSHSQPSLFAL